MTTLKRSQQAGSDVEHHESRRPVVGLYKSMYRMSECISRSDSMVEQDDIHTDGW